MKQSGTNTLRAKAPWEPRSSVYGLADRELGLDFRRTEIVLSVTIFRTALQSITLLPQGHPSLFPRGKNGQGLKQRLNSI